ncbi:unannotated protein [freshwater metagenome]|uniref:Unannotated protein n=1 Tax=freshwater metagenome TaxID=449393 RepID=A0A6J6E1X7_9ZZZZ
MRLCVRTRRDLHGGAAVFEWFACPGLQHGVDAFVHDLAAIGPGLAVGFVFARAIAEAANDSESAL